MKKAFSLILIPVLATVAGSVMIGVQFKLMIFILCALLFFVTIIRIDFALLILIISMLFSPEISLGGVSGRDIVIRFDDIFIFVIFFGWLAKMALNKELGFIKVTFLNKPILAYIAVYTIATILGVLTGHVSLKESTFYLLKYIEYFLLFFMVSNCLEDTGQVKFFLRAILVVGLAISVYACWQYLTGVGRVTAPFEGEAGGEANTLGGYLMLIMAVSIGMALNSTKFKEKVFHVLILLFAFPALLFTLSRSSWVAFMFAVFALIFLSRKGKAFLLLISIATLVLSTVIFPDFVRQRVTSTFVAENEYKLMNKKINLDDSTRARIETWQLAYKEFLVSPLVGHGAGSAGPTVDNQFARVIIEAGALGLITFVWLLISIFSNALSYLRELDDDVFSRSFLTGYIAAFIGLVVHAFGAGSFIIVRIMEPFWFLTALVVVLSENAPFIKQVKVEK